MQKKHAPVHAPVQHYDNDDDDDDDDVKGVVYKNVAGSEHCAKTC